MKLEFWLALTPALSLRRGRIVRRLLRKPATELIEPLSNKQGATDGCSLSPGERVRVRVRASVKPSFSHSS